MRFTFTISHTPGKELTVADDTLLRAPTHSASAAHEQLCQDAQMFVNMRNKMKMRPVPK